jgi:uncharacterized protein YbjT (DUF2867 family)
MRILVTGGTGHLGREVVRAALDTGHEVRVTSRRPHTDRVDERVDWAVMDLGARTGFQEALRGVDVVIHAASDPSNARTVDVDGTKWFAEQARDEGVSHFVFVSIVGVDRIPFPYYRRKLETERIIAEAGVPHSILRATQFHNFVDALLEKAGRFPLVLPLPRGFHAQSVAIEDVAERLMQAVEAGPGGLLRDFAGPEPMTLADIAATWKAARGVRKPTLLLPVPGRSAAAFRAGHNTAPDGDRGSIKWSEWLERTGS